MKLSKASFAAGAVTALILGSGTAYAATGGTFLLGKSNSAGATTSLTNSAGTALSLTSKSGTAPLKVSSSTKVANLNADKLDGLDSTSFAKASGQTGTIWSDGGVWIDLDSDQPDGDPYAEALFAYASCPTGTVLTGGGGEDDTPGGTLWLSEPVDTGVWAVASSTAPDSATIPDGTASDAIYAQAQCLNLKGSVPGASYRTAHQDPIDVIKARAAGKRL